MPAVQHTRLGRSSFFSRWPAWAGLAAAVWSLLYGLLGLYWAFGGRGFPFGAEHDPSAVKVSLLEHAQQDTAAPVIAVLGLGGALLALLLRSARLSRLAGRLATGTGWTLAVTLAVVVPDHRVLMAVARTPIVLIGRPFGWPEGVGFFGAGMFAWPVANQVLIMAGGLLWAAATIAYHRRAGDACTACGRADAPGGWTSPASATHWGRWAVTVAIIIPLLYATTRWAWALGIPLGVTRDLLREEARDTPDIWLAGAMLGAVAAAGSLLTLGLVQRWGEVYPRWMPFIGGKVVRPRTAIIPASLVALLVTNAGVHAIRAQIFGYYPEGSGLGQPNWATTAPGLLWPLWGAALAAAVLAYYLRRRGACRRCGRGEQVQPNRVPDRGRADIRDPQYASGRPDPLRLRYRAAAMFVPIAEERS